MRRKPTSPSGDLAGQGASGAEVALFGNITWGIREFYGQPILTATIDGDLHYEAVGLCRLTEHSNPSMTLRDVAKAEHTITLDITAAQSTLNSFSVDRPAVTLGPNPRRIFVTREGANRIVLDSRSEKARTLKEWLADDVMPSIEDTGSYVAPGSAASMVMPSLKILDPETLVVLGKLGQALTQTSDALIAEKAVTARQAKQLESAQSKAEYVDSFVDPAADNTLFRTFCNQIHAPEHKLRAHLMAKGILYKKLAGKRWSKSKEAWEDVYEYHAHAHRKTWFHQVDQVNAPRLHNRQLQTTLYVTPVGKVGIKKWLERNPIDGAE